MVALEILAGPGDAATIKKARPEYASEVKSIIIRAILSVVNGVQIAPMTTYRNRSTKNNSSYLAMLYADDE